ncbi:hypothetical protein AVEN_168535-1, partial [Araneus ventricosus]
SLVVRSLLRSRWDPGSNSDSLTIAVFLGLAHVKYVGVRRPYAGGALKFGEGGASSGVLFVMQTQFKITNILYGGSNWILPDEIFDKPLQFGIRTRRAFLESLRATTDLKRTSRALLEILRDTTVWKEDQESLAGKPACHYCVKSYENFQVCYGGKDSKILCAWRQPVPWNKRETWRKE